MAMQPAYVQSRPLSATTDSRTFGAGLNRWLT